MEMGHDPHYNIAQAQRTSNESDNFFSQSDVLLFRASNKSDNFFQPIRCPTVITSLISVHLVISDLHYAASGRVHRRRLGDGRIEGDVRRSTPSKWWGGLGQRAAGPSSGTFGLCRPGAEPLCPFSPTDPWPTLAKEEEEAGKEKQEEVHQQPAASSSFRATASSPNRLERLGGEMPEDVPDFSSTTST
jgi:hypothetical protein